MVDFLNGVMGNMLTQMAMGILGLLILCVLALAFYFGVIKQSKRFKEFYCVIKEFDSFGHCTVSYDNAGIFVHPQSRMKLFRMQKANHAFSLTSKDGREIVIPYVTRKKDGRKIVSILKRNDQYSFLSEAVDGESIAQRVTQADINNAVDLIRRGDALFKPNDWSKVAQIMFLIVATVCIVILVVQVYQKNVEISKIELESNKVQAQAANAFASAASSFNSTIAQWDTRWERLENPQLVLNSGDTVVT